MMDENNECLVLPETLSLENVSPVLKEIKQRTAGRQPFLEIDFQKVREMDSSAIALLNYLKRNYPQVSIKNLSAEWNQLSAMFPLTTESPEKPVRDGIISRWLESIADHYYSVKQHFKAYLTLLADEIYYTFQYLVKRRGVYPGEIFNQVFFMGYKSFPIVSLSALLVGITTSVISLQQLRLFGADIYIADLVGFGMVVELVPLITGIIMAGKIGASITAEIASMKVLEETDALKTMGLIPEKFLMVPRLIAITIAVPLLVAIADFVGVFAGVVVTRIVSDIPANMFLNEMFSAVDAVDFLNGLLKTMVFGWVIIITSGYKGFSVKQGAVGVGIATTQSVVLSISLTIVFDCVFALILYG